MKAASFTAAGTLPAKVIQQVELLYRGGKIRPIHVQISPTNRCNLQCEFCSCANRTGALEMPIGQYLDIMEFFRDRGCLAVTITGGGEPTLHRDINTILLATHRMGIQTGLVTNGLALDRLSPEALFSLTWCRISFSDDREYEGEFLQQVLGAVSIAPKVDWAFSYVLTDAPNLHNIALLVELANDLKFTHVRLVSDLLNLDQVTSMDTVREHLRRLGIDDSKVIYQGRKQFTAGRKDCLISLLKPVIGTDGGWYPCCGIQYAFEQTGLDFEKSACMGFDPAAIHNEGKAFDGSKCVRCYYDEYNEVLGALVSPLKHEYFV